VDLPYHYDGNDYFNEEGEELDPYDAFDADLRHCANDDNFLFDLKHEILRRVTGTDLDRDIDQMSPEWQKLHLMLEALMSRCFIEGYKWGSTDAAETAVEALKTYRHDGYTNPE